MKAARRPTLQSRVTEHCGNLAEPCSRRYGLVAQLRRIACSAAVTLSTSAGATAAGTVKPASTATPASAIVFVRCAEFPVTETSWPAGPTAAPVCSRAVGRTVPDWLPGTAGMGLWRTMTMREWRGLCVVAVMQSLGFAAANDLSKDGQRFRTWWAGFTALLPRRQRI